MAWKKTKAKEEKLTPAEYKKEAERISNELADLKKKSPREEGEEETPAGEPEGEKQPEPKQQISRVEVFDVIEGNLNRVYSMIQLLK